MSTSIIRFLPCVIPGAKQIMVRREHLSKSPQENSQPLQLYLVIKFVCKRNRSEKHLEQENAIEHTGALLYCHVKPVKAGHCAYLTDDLRATLGYQQYMTCPFLYWRRTQKVLLLRLLEIVWLCKNMLRQNGL